MIIVLPDLTLIVFGSKKKKIVYQKSKCHEYILKVGYINVGRLISRIVMIKEYRKMADHDYRFNYIETERLVRIFVLQRDLMANLC